MAHFRAVVVIDFQAEDLEIAKALVYSGDILGYDGDIEDFEVDSILEVPEVFVLNDGLLEEDDLRSEGV